LFATSSGLVRIAYRDPEHVSERLMLAAVQRLGEPSHAWAQAAIADRPGVDQAAIAGELYRQSAGVARIDGAIAGSPFFVALVPGYLGYLWQEALMVLRTGALYGRDPREQLAAAELLALRGVHETTEAAQRALDALATTPLPDKPEHRRPLRTWVGALRSILVLGGFISAPADRTTRRKHERLRTLGAVVLAAIIWVITWVFPVTFMALMAWTCERNARDLGRRALSFYGGSAAATRATATAARSSEDRLARGLIRTVALALSIAVPIAFVAYADHVRKTTGVNAVGAAGALVALSLVIAVAIAANRR